MTRLNNSFTDVDDAIRNRFYKYQIEMAEHKNQKGWGGGGTNPHMRSMRFAHEECRV